MKPDSDIFYLLAYDIYLAFVFLTLKFEIESDSKVHSQVVFCSIVLVSCNIYS